MTEELTPPNIPVEFRPRHIALVMDGNGRWAEQRGLKRTEGHKRGEAVLLDMVAACQALDIPYLSAYAFSTENWRRSADEVRFLMGFNRDVLTRQKMWLHERGVKFGGWDAVPACGAACCGSWSPRRSSPKTTPV